MIQENTNHTKDIYLTKQEGPKGAHEELHASKIVEFSIDKENQESKFESEEGVKEIYKHQRNHKL